MCKKCRGIFGIIGFMTVVIGGYLMCCGKKKRFCCANLMDQCCKDIKEDATDLKNDMMCMCQDMKKAGSSMMQAVMDNEKGHGNGSC